MPTRQLPHEYPEIEAADMHEQALQDVGMPAQMRPAHPPGLVEMRVGPFEQLAPLPQQPLPPGAPNPPAIGVDRGTGRRLVLPVAPPAIRLRDGTAQAQLQEGGPPGGRSYTASSCSYSASGSSGAMPGPHDPNQSGNPHQEEIRDQAIEQDPRRAE